MKSESEKFAGALRTYSIEALMGDGRALQAGTSHNLGQNFAKAFDITFQARDKSVQHVWGTSWGVTTRLVGAVDHDARRRQRPGAAAARRAVPGRRSCRSAATTGARPCCRGRRRFSASSPAAGIRVTLDEREERPGWKFAEWELRGVPLRLEIGPKDIEKSQVLIARRDTREKLSVPMDGLAGAPARAARRRSSRTCSSARCSSATSTRSASTATTRSSRRWKGVPASSSRRGAASADCEAQIKTDTQATIRNMPLDGTRAGGTVRPLRQRRRTAEAWFAKSY